MTRWRLQLAGVGAVAFVAHATVLGAGFVWLDHGDLEQGAALAAPSGWPGLFTRGFARTGFYRPLMALSLSIDSLAGSAAVFHLTSLLSHALAAVLVVLAAESYGLTRRASLTAGLLFGVHPVGSLVAGAIAYRAESLITCSLLGLLLAHRRRSPAWAAVALLAGALTKETALVAGPLLLLTAALVDPAMRGTRRLWAAEAGALGLALALRVAHAPAWKLAPVALAPGDALGTRLATVTKSAGHLLLPWRSTLCDAFPVTSLSSGAAVAGGLLLLGAGVAALWRKGPALGLAVALLPALQLVPTPRFWSPHYLYLPLAFAAMLLAEQVYRLGRAEKLGVAVVTGGLLTASLTQGLRFHDDESLFGPEVAAEPRCREAQLYLADVRRARGDLEGAGRGYEAALAPVPGWLSYTDGRTAWQNLGLVRLRQGRLEEADHAVREALRLTASPLEQRRLGVNLASIALARGDPSSAERQLASESARADALAEALYLRAKALFQLGRAAESRALVERLTQLPSTPGSPR